MKFKITPFFKLKNKAFALFILCAISVPLSANVFIDDVMAKGEIYETYSRSEEAAHMALEGKQNEVDAKLIALVPDEDKTAEDFFLLANMLYENNHQLSFDLMQKAYKLNSEEVFIIYEMAMHHHRVGNYQEAINFYLQSMESDEIGKGHKGYALLADCYLRTGEYEKALDAWIYANPYGNRHKIEKAIYHIYGDESSVNKRSTLISQIRSGELIKIGDLIVLDHNWFSDWWNKSVQEEYLVHDLKLIEQVLKGQPRLLSEAILLNDILAHKVNTEQFLKKLEELKIWGSEKRLPDIPALTYYMVKKMTDLELVTVDEIVIAYEAELLNKKNNQTIDDSEFKILSFLYASTDEEKIKDLDYFAWKKRNSQVSAENYFVNLYSNDNLEVTELNQALDDFPNSVILNNLHLRMNQSEQAETDIYAAMVAAEYPNIKVVQTSEKLRAFYRSLAKKIKHKSYTETLKQ